MDVVDLQPGDDFVEVIKEAVGSCDALVAVIGPRWLDARDPSGARKIDDPDDWARLEIEASLERDVRVVPALVSGATMPRSSELPSSMAAFTRRHAVELSHLRWTDDVGRLVSAINRALETDRTKVGGRTAAEPTPAGRKKWSLGDTTFDGDWEEVGRRRETYGWPDGVVDTLDPLVVFQGTGDYTPFTLGVGHKENGEVIGFVLDRGGRVLKGITAFFPADDYAQTHEVVSMIRGGGAMGRSGFQPSEELPRGYQGLSVGVLKQRVAGKWNVQAVVARADDDGTILAHTALQARLRELA